MSIILMQSNLNFATLFSWLSENLGNHSIKRKKVTIFSIQVRGNFTECLP